MLTLWWKLLQSKSFKFIVGLSTVLSQENRCWNMKILYTALLVTGFCAFEYPEYQIKVPCGIGVYCDGLNFVSFEI